MRGQKLYARLPLRAGRLRDSRGSRVRATHPGPQVLLGLAEQRNRQKLPELGRRYGLRLPPEEDCLLAPNYQLQRPPVSMAEDTDAAMAGAHAPPGAAAGSHGARRVAEAKQIHINLKARAERQ